MELEPHHSIEVITVATTYSPNSSGKNVVPLQIELEKFPSQKEIDGPDNKLRRPVRPIDRQRMRPWLMELLDCGDVFGLRWMSRCQGIFQISWKHASRLGWNLETDGDVFERWARHTGIYKEGDPPEPKRWKANFRCALHSLNDVVELTNAVERRGRFACRTYKFLQTGDDLIWSKKKAKQKKSREMRLILPSPIVEAPKAVATVTIESTSHEEMMSENELEEVPQDKVIVEKVDSKMDMADEDYVLQHDHDYSGKTIVLRQGVGSILLQKEVVAAPEEDSVNNLLISNLDQLASAAAGLEAQTEVSDSMVKHSGKREKQKGKKKGTKDKANVVESGSALKEFLLGSRWLEDSEEIPSPKGKKVFTPSEVSRAIMSEEGEAARHKAYKGRKRKLSETAKGGKASKSSASKSPVRPVSPPMTRQRKGASVSPKAGARKTRKPRKEEKSDTSEPLMTSCLLLLEAATRLDDAEKRSSAGTTHTDESSSGHEGEAVCDDDDDPKLEICASEEVSEEYVIAEEDKVRVEEEIEEVVPEQMEVEVKTEPEMDQDSLVIHLDDGSACIVSTAPSEPTPPVTRSKKSPAKSFITVLECTKTPEPAVARGLFSGSSIDSAKEQKPEIVKRVRPLPTTKVTLRSDTNTQTNSGGSVLIVETSSSASSTALTTSTTSQACQTEASTVQSNSGVQQTVIQRALPVLNAQVQKSGSSSPVVVTHKVSGLAGTPQIVMSPSAGSPSLMKSSSGKGTSDTPSKAQSPLLRSELLNHLIKNKNLVPLKSLSPGPTAVSRSVASGTVLGTATVTSSPTVSLSPKVGTSAPTSLAGKVVQVSKSPVVISQGKSVSALGSRTILLTRAATVAQENMAAKNKDIVVSEQAKQKSDNVKVRLIPGVKKSIVTATKANTPLQSSEVSGTNSKLVTTSPSTTAATIEDTQAGKATPINIAAQVVFDPQHGPLLKLPSGATLPLQSCILQSQKSEDDSGTGGNSTVLIEKIKVEAEAETSIKSSDLIVGETTGSDGNDQQDNKETSQPSDKSSTAKSKAVSETQTTQKGKSVTTVAGKKGMSTKASSSHDIEMKQDSITNKSVVKIAEPAVLSLPLFAQASDAGEESNDLDTGLRIREDYDSRMMIDPRTPLSLGEVPLFAPSAAESDSGSPASDAAE